MKKDEKLKVGRPKLADKNLKVDSIIMCLIGLVLILILMVGGTLTIFNNLNTKKLAGNVVVSKTNNYCHFYVENVSGNSATIKWYCTDGNWVDNFTFYKNVNGKKKKVKYFNANAKHAKSDRLLITGFKNNTQYYVGFHDKNSKNTLLTFKTNYSGTSGNEKLKSTRKPDPYVWVSENNSNYVKISYRGFGASVTSHTTYNDKNCDGKTNGETVKNGTVVEAVPPQIGSYKIYNLIQNKCYITQVKFSDNTIKSAYYTTKNLTTKKDYTPRGQCYLKSQGKCNGTSSLYYSCKWMRGTCVDHKVTRYRVKYNANGGTGTMYDQFITYGTKTKLTKNKFVKAGYVFDGWVAKRSSDGYYYGVNSNGKKGWYKSPKNYSKYNDGATVSETVPAGKDVTMIAQWKQKPITKKTSKKNETTKNSSNVFRVESNGSNCYTVYSPKDAKNWRVHVYYKSTSASSYGSNKFIAYNHYNDGVKSQKVCFKKQKYNNENYRILVKWTTGANDKTYGNINGWKPSGWSVNNSIGWAYKDYKVSW